MTSFQANRVIFLLVVYFIFVINRHYGNFTLDIVKENLLDILHGFKLVFLLYHIFLDLLYLYFHPN